MDGQQQINNFKLKLVKILNISPAADSIMFVEDVPAASL